NVRYCAAGHPMSRHSKATTLRSGSVSLEPRPKPRANGRPATRPGVFSLPDAIVVSEPRAVVVPPRRLTAMDLIALYLSWDGVTNGAIYALVAVGLVLVFSVTRIVLIPQGDFIALGGL